jgi:hypothetical protein
MLRRLSLAVAVTFLGCTGLALGQPAGMHSNRHTALSGSSTGTTPKREAGTTPNQFASEAEGKSHCGSDTVVWVNTKTHVYHFPGSGVYGHTKYGAFMCRADADRIGSFHAAKNEKASASR